MTEIIEAYIRWAVVCIFLLAVKALVGSMAFLFDGWAASLARAEEIMAMVLGVVFATVAITVAVRQTLLLNSLSGPADLKRRGRPEADGFTHHACRSAAFWSVLLTGGGLAILQTVSTRVALPGAFFIKLALFICCASFAISYWIIAGATADEPVEA
ncbi:MAG: hypothetical protein M3Y79_00355 [Pseudomonadota bacterium]|nr:hypothetical protein [Pseudomonadota bacterium]